MRTLSEFVKELEESLKKRYTAHSYDEENKVMDNITNFVHRINQQKDLQSILAEAARLIHRQLFFREVCIGLKSVDDGLFYYAELLGYTRKAEEEHRKISYTYDEMIKPRKYSSGIRISRLTELCLVEMESYREGEETSYNRPILLSKERASMDDFMEGDYFDVYMYGHGNELIGWVEVSGTRDDKMPPINSLKLLEIFTSILGLVVDREMRNSRYSVLRRP